MHTYIKECETAILQIYKGLEYYKDLLDNCFSTEVLTIPIDTPAEEIDRITEKWAEDNKDKISEEAENQRRYFAQSFSKQTLCGALLQIAFMGIKIYGKPTDIPENIIGFAPKKSNSRNTFKKFCSGRIVRGLPIGLIVYAGRNQYNHHDESDSLSKTNSQIFEIISKNHGIKDHEDIKEPGLDLNNEKLEIYSSNILSILGWFNLENFENDLNSILH